MLRAPEETDRARHVELIMMSNFDRSAGGRETWAHNFIPELLEADHALRLTIYGIRKEDGVDGAESLLEAIGAENRSRVRVMLFDVRRGRLPYFFSMLTQLTRYARTASAPPPDYTLGIGSVSELVMMLASQRFRQSRKVLWLRTIYLSEKAYRLTPTLLRWARRAEPLLLGRADLLLTNGDDIREYYEQHGLVSHVIKNGVDARKWSLPPPQLEGMIRVGYVGRLSKVKGIEDFLNLARLVKGSPDGARFEFHVMGEGPYMADVLACQAKGLLTCHGAIDNRDMPKALARLDVCVALTFASEALGGGGTSNALMEQMAAGRVIVAWDNVIFRQLLGESSAYMVTQGDVDGLAMALRTISEAPAAALARAEGARSTIGAYSVEAQVAKFQHVLSQAESSPAQKRFY